MLWTEKYRPKNFDDVLGNIKAKKEILEWTEEWKNGNPQKCLFLIGPPGTGKTTFAGLIAGEFSDSVELNASDKRSYDAIMGVVGEASSSMTLFGNRLKLIILDEVDGLHGNDDRGGSRAINKILKDAIQPIVMMANDPYSNRIKSFKNKCQVINLRKVHTNSIVSLLKKICVKEGVEFEEHVLRTLAKRSNGDLRSAINDLEIMAKGEEKITSEDLDIVAPKDGRSNVFDAVRTILKSKTPAHIKDAMRQIEADPSLLIEMVTENIPREYEKKDEIEKAYEMISQADIYLGRAFSTRAYTYWKYAYELMSVGVALSKDETYKKFARYTNSSVYTILSKNRSKRDLQNRVAEKIGEKLHTSKKVAISQFPYFEIMFQDDDIAYNMMTYFGLEDDEVKVFRSRKVKTPKKPKTKKKSTKTSKSVSKEAKSEETNVNNETLKTQKKVKKATSSTDPKRTKKPSKRSKKASSDEEPKKKEDTGGSKEKQVSLFSFK
ncbi:MULTISPECIES: replication factor C large subunit [Methanobacterium]|jgi:replication factor C large subunit|uniref:Replication factor C large subunit n=1 Tax=Methanobacterium veterum TaxID=408577 RepID=A0A9E4ZW72_9EURY|nr:MULTISPECIES: replication factor C large subunit [Methanobacterium]MCZ3364763.1 replication factor C large subunit [Methanobacterium veterum]MCZ3372517.1 replication factor C large subunit [Methanobacterium veterum]